MDPAIKFSKFLNGVKAQPSKIGSFGKFVIGAAGLTATALVVKNFAINAIKKEPPQNIQQGTKKQIDVARRQGEFPPNILKEKIMNNSSIEPMTLKVIEKS